MFSASDKLIMGMVVLVMGYLAYIGGSYLVSKEGLENGNGGSANPPNPPTSQADTIIIFTNYASKDNGISNGISNGKSNPNSDIYQYAQYDNETSPQQNITYQTNNMFSAVPPSTGNPYSFNISSYNES